MGELRPRRIGGFAGASRPREAHVDGAFAIHRGEEEVMCAELVVTLLVGEAA
jgi:hypothetical protein